MPRGSDVDTLKPQKYTYWIIVVIPELYENLTELQPLLNMLRNFRKQVGKYANVDMPLPGSYATIWKDVLSISWDKPTKTMLAQKDNPYLLVLPCAFSVFKPKVDDHVVIEIFNPLAASTQHIGLLNDIKDEIVTKKRIVDWKYTQITESVPAGLTSKVIDTHGGAVVQGNVNTGGDFIGRDKIEINIYLHS